MSSSARCEPWPSGPVRVDVRVPPLHEFLHARHVDRAVVEVVLDLGQVGGEESTIGADGVAAQRHAGRFGNMLLDELQRRGTGDVEADGRRLDLVEQAGLGVHVDHERVHTRQHVVGLVDHEIGPFGDDLEVVVGDDRCNLDDHVGRVVESGHFQVHPHEHRRHCTAHMLRSWCDDRLCRPSSERPGSRRSASSGDGWGSWRITAAPSKR